MLWLKMPVNFPAVSLIILWTMRSIQDRDLPPPQPPPPPPPSFEQGALKQWRFEPWNPGGDPSAQKKVLILDLQLTNLAMADEDGEVVARFFGSASGSVVAKVTSAALAGLGTEPKFRRLTEAAREKCVFFCGFFFLHAHFVIIGEQFS